MYWFLMFIKLFSTTDAYLLQVSIQSIQNPTTSSPARLPNVEREDALGTRLKTQPSPQSPFYLRLNRNLICSEN